MISAGLHRDAAICRDLPCWFMMATSDPRDGTGIIAAASSSAACQKFASVEGATSSQEVHETYRLASGEARSYMRLTVSSRERPGVA